MFAGLSEVPSSKTFPNMDQVDRCRRCRPSANLNQAPEMTGDSKISNRKRIARRLFLKNLVSATTIAGVAPRLLMAEKEAIHPRVTREVFVKSPGKGTAVMAFGYYTPPKGLEMMSIEQRWSR